MSTVKSENKYIVSTLYIYNLFIYLKLEIRGWFLSHGNYI